MDLPTYTNIWRIEKRLYKIYDFRLPFPLPIGQIAVFVWQSPFRTSRRLSRLACPLTTACSGCTCCRRWL